MKGFRSSLALSFAQRYSVSAIQLVAMVVIARLLTPAEIGAFAVGFALIAFLQTLCESGIESYLIQERELTDERIRTAFTVALIWSWCLALALAWAHEVIGQWLAEPSVGRLLLALSVVFIVLPMQVLVVALLRRKMAFGVLYVIGTAAAFLSATTAILLASLGWGFMALAWAAVVETLTTVVIAWRWRVDVPRRLLGLSDWRRVAAFAGWAAPASGLNGLTKLTAAVATGRLLGLEAAGLLNRARRVVDVFSEGVLQAVAPVALPALAAHQREGKSLRTAYLLKVAIISGAAWPFFLFMALTAHLVVPVLLGSQWDEAIPLTRTLCLMGLALPFHVADSKFLIVLGRMRAYLWTQMAQQLLNVVLIVGAALVSVQLVAVALAFGKLLKVLMTNAVLSRELDYGLAELGTACARSVGVTAVSAIVPAALLLIGYGSGAEGPFLGLVAAALGFATGWLAGVLVLNHPLRVEIVHGWRHARTYLAVRNSA